METAYADPVTLLPVPDFKSGSAAIARLPLTQPAQAAIELMRLLDSLQAFPPDGAMYFDLLEQMRLPVVYITGELSKHYLTKPLPLVDIDEQLFLTVISLWNKTAKAYAHCTNTSDTETPAQYGQRIATVLHRCLLHTSMVIFEHQRARRELPWGLWLDLHGYYATAEEWQVATQPVKDPLDPLGREVTCLSAYTCTLLCEMATPYSLSLREVTLVRRWATLWSHLVTIHPVTPGESLPPFIIELMQDSALRPTAECLQTNHLRRLDTSRLSQQIADTRLQLRQRVLPSQLMLGDDCSTTQCQRLFEYLVRPWAQARAARKFRRHATTGIAKLCTGFEEMHYFVSGQPFEQPDNAAAYSRQEFERLFTLRQDNNPLLLASAPPENAKYHIDEWEVVNQSANGFRLMRSMVGRKMTHGQLVALRPHDGERYLLAKITWLMQENEGRLISGIMALPGMATAIAARHIDAHGVPTGPYERAFLITPIGGAKAAQSIVVPHGWFRSGLIVQLFDQWSWRIQLDKIIDMGADYEQLSFTPCT